jgi:hypothetical protein
LLVTNNVCYLSKAISHDKLLRVFGKVEGKIKFYLLQLTIYNKTLSVSASLLRFVRLARSLELRMKFNTYVDGGEAGGRKGVEFCDAGVPVN